MYLNNWHVIEHGIEQFVVCRGNAMVVTFHYISTRADFLNCRGDAAIKHFRALSLLLNSYST